MLHRPLAMIVYKNNHRAILFLNLLPMEVQNREFAGLKKDWNLGKSVIVIPSRRINYKSSVKYLLLIV